MLEGKAIPKWRPAETELPIENYFCAQAEKHGCKAWKWQSRAVRGVPDRILMVPWLNGKPVLVELKAPGKPPTKFQAKKHAQMRALGMWVVVIDSRVEVDALFRELDMLR